MKKERAWKNKTAWKLYLENWKICHEIIDLREGRVCQIPGCGTSIGLDLDHVFSRKCRTLFFDTGNMGYLCKPHHQHKSFRNGQWVDMMVKEICKIRQGDEWWEYAMTVSRNVCRDFKKTFYQEEMNIKLKEELSEYLERREERGF